MRVRAVTRKQTTHLFKRRLVPWSVVVALDNDRLLLAGKDDLI
jgi:hypothetical protein